MSDNLADAFAAKLRAELDEGHSARDLAERHGIRFSAVLKLLADPDAALCEKCKGVDHDADGHSCGACKGTGIRA